MSTPNFLQTMFAAPVVQSTIAPDAHNPAPVITLQADKDYTVRGPGTYISAGEHVVSVDELSQAVREIDARRTDQTVSLHSLDFEARGDVLHVHGRNDHAQPVDLAVREHAMNQMSERLTPSHGAAIAAYLRAWDAPNQADLLNRHMRKHINTMTRTSPTQWLLRAFEGDARATLSKGYATISNTRIVDEFARITTGQHLPDLQLAPGSYVSPDAFRFDTVWRNVQPSDGPEGGYGIGLSFSNNYIGTGMYRAAFLLWRGKCRNSILIDLDESEVSIRHRGGSAERLAVASVEAFTQYALEKSGVVVAQMVRAEHTAIPVPDWGALLDASLGVAGADKLTDRERDNALIGTEGRVTWGGLLNGLTYTAHQTEGMSDARSMELQRAAGWLLMHEREVMQTAERTAAAPARISRRRSGR